jgi:hypothetical protein
LKLKILRLTVDNYHYVNDNDNNIINNDNNDSISFRCKTKEATHKPVTLHTSRLTAEQLNTGWFLPLQPRRHCPIVYQVYPCDTDSDCGEWEGYN